MQRKRHGRSYGSGAKPHGPRPGHSTQSTHSSHSGRSSRPKSYKLTCSGCGKEVIVQVAPPEDKKLLCMDCYKK